MSKRSKPSRQSRRDFLKGVAVMGGAATVGLVAGPGRAEPEAPGTAEAPRRVGYRVTVHVKEYYEKARF